MHDGNGDQKNQVLLGICNYHLTTRTKRVDAATWIYWEPHGYRNRFSQTSPCAPLILFLPWRSVPEVKVCNEQPVWYLVDLTKAGREKRMFSYCQNNICHTEFFFCWVEKLILYCNLSITWPTWPLPEYTFLEDEWMGFFSFLCY